MRRIPYDLLVTLFLLLAAVGMAYLPSSLPDGAARLTSAIAATGFLLATVLVLAGIRPRMKRPAGFLPLLAGLLVLGGAAALSPFPRASDAVAAWISPRYLAHEEFLLVARAVGALAVALGFTVWVRSMVHRSVRAEMRKNTLEREIEHLGDRVKTQAESLAALDLYDPITPVLNRRAFLTSLERTAQRDAHLGESFTFALIRAVEYEGAGEREDDSRNETLLLEIARALRSSTRGTDTVGRLGGGDFGVVLGECQDPGPAVHRILFALEGGPGARKKNPLHVNVGLVTVDDPDDHPTFAELHDLAEELVESVPADGSERVARAPFRRSRSVAADISVNASAG